MFENITKDERNRYLTIGIILLFIFSTIAIYISTPANSGRCHGSFCTARLMKILSEETKTPLTGVTKRGKGSELVKKDRIND